MFIRNLSIPGRAEWNTPHSATQQRFFCFELACVAEIQPTTVGGHENLNENLYSSWRAPVFSRPGSCGGHAWAGKSIHRQIQGSNGRQGHSRSGGFPLHTRLRPGGARVLEE